MLCKVHRVKLLAYNYAIPFSAGITKFSRRINNLLIVRCMLTVAVIAQVFDLPSLDTY
jgi:hypothetical protein